MLLQTPPPTHHVGHGLRSCLADAQLKKANLTHALLEEADLPRARLDEASLAGAWLTHARLTDTWLDGADLTGAWLDGADLATAATLTGQQVISSLAAGDVPGDGRVLRDPLGESCPRAEQP
ncbi:pentapeptide repeat-containing protein [Streptomyces specialis]|uniref:pentapeptide repeat-containing protein n=1 Tax=Streptomyces specialis TaxID=498367 RepID=UPI00099EE844